MILWLAGTLMLLWLDGSVNPVDYQWNGSWSFLLPG